MRFLLICMLFISTTAKAETPDVVFGSMRKNEVNVRSGPGTQFPILWVYKRYGYPVEILTIYQSWYKIKDLEGETGWIYKGLLSKRRTSLINEGKPVVMYKNSDATNPIVRLAPDVIVAIDHCTPHLCQVVHGKRKGWVIKNRLSMGVD